MAEVLVGVVLLFLHTLVYRAGLVFVGVVVVSVVWDVVNRLMLAGSVLQLVDFVGWTGGPGFDELEGRGKAVVFGERSGMQVEIACSGVVWEKRFVGRRAVGVMGSGVCDCRDGWEFC